MPTQMCASPVQMTVEILPNLMVTVQKENADCSGNPGKASVTVNGGVDPYSYIWSNGSDSTKAVNLMEGAYSVVVTDVNGCTGTASFEISIDDTFDAVALQIPNVITPNNDGKNDEFELPFLNNPCVEMEIHILNRWGATVYRMNEDHPIFGGMDTQGNKLADGIYFYQVASKQLECNKEENKGKCSGFIHLLSK